MGKPRSEDLRIAVVGSIEAGYTREEVSALYDVSLSSVGRYIKRWRTTGNVRAAKFGGYKGYALAGHRDRIEQWIAEQPDITLGELQARLAKAKMKVSVSAIFRFLHHLKLTFKKSPARGRAGPARRRGRAPDVAQEAASA
jgi:transposase